LSNLIQAVHKEQWRDLSLRRQEDEITEKIFQSQRNSLISFYALAMRMDYMISDIRKQTEDWNATVPAQYARPVPALSEPTREWFSAAILMLTHTDEETQKQFLTLSDDRRAKLVQAVIDDGGIQSHDGAWQEIPQ
jgi:hypothetical protein